MADSERVGRILGRALSDFRRIPDFCGERSESPGRVVAGFNRDLCDPDGVGAGPC